MSPPDLKLVEVCDPPVVGNTLYVEQPAGDAGVFVLLCGSDEDPSTKGYSMELKREAAVRLRDWLNLALA